MSNDARHETGTAHTTGFVHVHTEIGNRDGVIVELRRDDHEQPWNDDMSHLSDKKAVELRDELNDYLNEKAGTYCYGCGSEDGLEAMIVDGKVNSLCPSCDPDRRDSS